MATDLPAGMRQGRSSWGLVHMRSTAKSRSYGLLTDPLSGGSGFELAIHQKYLESMSFWLLHPFVICHFNLCRESVPPSFPSHCGISSSLQPDASLGRTQQHCHRPGQCDTQQSRGSAEEESRCRRALGGARGRYHGATGGRSGSGGGLEQDVDLAGGVGGHEQAARGVPGEAHGTEAGTGAHGEIRVGQDVSQGGVAAGVVDGRAGGAVKVEAGQVVADLGRLVG